MEEEASEITTLRRKIQESIDFMTFACDPNTVAEGSMGFLLHSESGDDFSFVVYIEKTDEGKKAYGRFESPEHANVLATMPAEVFLQVYSGEASLSLISRMIFRGKISIRNYDVSAVSQFMSAFEFSSQKWEDFYAFRDKIDNIKRTNNYFLNLFHPLDFQFNRIVKPSYPDSLINKLCYEYCAIPPLYTLLPTSLQDDYLSTVSTHSRLYSVFTPSIPMLDEMPEDEECMDFPAEDDLEDNQREDNNLFIHLHNNAEKEGDQSSSFEDKAKIVNSKSAFSEKRKITIDKHDLSPMGEVKPSTISNGWWDFFTLKRGFDNTNGSKPNSTSTDISMHMPNNSQSTAENWKETIQRLEEVIEDPQIPNFNDEAPLGLFEGISLPNPHDLFNNFFRHSHTSSTMKLTNNLPFRNNE